MSSSMSGGSGTWLGYGGGSSIGEVGDSKTEEVMFEMVEELEAEGEVEAVGR